MKIKMFSFLIIVMAFSSCIKKSVEGVVLSDATTFEKKMSAPNVQLIDVRTPEEFAEGHLPKAVNIDVTSDDFETRVTSLDKEQPVMVYCKMGGRSAKAAEKLNVKIYLPEDHLCGSEFSENVTPVVVNSADIPDGLMGLDIGEHSAKVFKNVIENACKFSPDQKCDVRIWFADKQIQVKITDEGIGIAAQELPHIFEPFYRSETSRQEKGHGIGLFLTQKIILLHNAKITVLSEGNETIFAVIFDIV